MKPSGKAKTQYWNWTGLYYLLYKCAFGDPHYWACTSITIFLPDRQGKKESHHELHGKHRRYVAGIRQIDTRSGRGCEKKIESHSKPFQTILSAVFGAFSVSCFLLGHQIAKMDKQPAEKHLEAIFASRRARLLTFCQKEKNLSHPPSPPNFLHHINDLPGEIFVSISDEKYMVKLSRWLDNLCSQEGWLNQSLSFLCHESGIQRLDVLEKPNRTSS